jgi:lysine 2,3-aminomutase
MKIRWQEELRSAVTSPAELAEVVTVDAAQLRQVTARYPMRISRYYLELGRKSGIPIWRQCIPDLQELADTAQQTDPLTEEQLSPVPGLIHRYPDRVVLIVSMECAVYCRFCMRKRGVGCSGVIATDIDAAISYIAANEAIRDVILSGGDPLLLEDDVLADLLRRLRAIPHVEIIRIGSRTPVTLPSRITPALCTLLKASHPVYLNTHFNHPVELTPEAAEACVRLADSGIPVGNQTVLLRGVNDDQSVMIELMTGLLKIRVKPYYIHQMDLVRGTAHFRTPLKSGLDIIDSLRGHISGLATPYFVIDLPGGKGKVPLLPEYVQRRGNAFLIKNYRGEQVEYFDP